MDRPLEIRPLADVQAPIENWCQSCDDPWLIAKVRRQAGYEGPLSVAEAVGIFVRLKKFSPDEARSKVQQLLGKAPQESMPEMAWVHGLTADQLKSIEDVALAATDMMFEELVDALRVDWVEDLDAWRARASDLLELRDSLEGVSLILRWRSCGQILVGALQRIDEEAAKRCPGIAREVGLSEQLVRAGCVHPTSWWIQTPRVRTR